MIEVTLLGTGSPIPDANRAGPSTLVRAGVQTFLVDCGRGVQQRLTAAGAGANALSALLLTHLHSDHIADLGDLIITRWVTTFTRPMPLPIIGPPGTAEVVDATFKAFGFDIGYRIAHHADLASPPPVEVHEYTEGMVWGRDGVLSGSRQRITGRWPTIGFRVEHGGASVVWPGTPCRVRASARWRKGPVVGAHRDSQGPGRSDADAADPRHLRLPLVGGTGRGHRRAGGRRHPHPHPLRAGIEPGQEDEWRALAATVFDRQIEVGDDLHRVEVHPGVCAKPVS